MNRGSGTQPVFARPQALQGLGSRLPVWDELYLVCHDYDSGAPRVHVGALGIGLAGATLIDLLLNQQVALRDGRVSILEPQVRGDVIADAALSGLRQGPRMPAVSVWLRQFAGSGGLYERVRAQLVARGLLRRQRRRMREDRYPPVDTTWTIRAQARLRSVLYGHEAADHQAAALAGLVDALGAPSLLGMAEPDQKVSHGLRVVASAHLPPVRYVIGCVAEGVGDHATAAYR